MRRVAVVISAFVLTSFVLSGQASADPKGERLELTCVGIPSGFIATNGKGNWTPGLGLDTGVYVPYQIDFKVYFTPDGQQETMIDEGSEAKKNVPKNAKSHPHGECTFVGTEQLVGDPVLGTGVIRFEGRVLAFYTGK